ncbi:hypothetical protein ROZALSC1DRAFT_25919, partial [Rozella allomycis CSF55]
MSTKKKKKLEEDRRVPHPFATNNNRFSTSPVQAMRSRNQIASARTPEEAESALPAFLEDHHINVSSIGRSSTSIEAEERTNRLEEAIHPIFGEDLANKQERKIDFANEKERKIAGLEEISTSSCDIASIRNATQDSGPRVGDTQ